MGRTADVTFLNQSHEKASTSRDLILFYVIRGRTDIKTAEQTIPLRQEDLLAINPGEQFTLTIISGVLARIAFRHEEVYALLQGKTRQVSCCSVRVRDGSYDALCFQVQALLNTLLQDDLGMLSFERHSCDLLLTLLSEYSVVVEEPDRKQAVEQWMESVSREPVTLEDAARHFHLTPQYFSRWFASAFDCTFLKYLSEIRCRKARKELLEGDASILRIAMDQGFPNAASFTKTFSQHYGDTPLQYRKKHAAIQRSGVLEPGEVAPYLKREQDSIEEKIKVLQIDCGGDHPRLNPYWNRLCCLGDLSMLADLEVQTHVAELNKRVRFRHTRVFLRKGKHDGFYVEDRAMSFLFEQELTPYFVVDVKDAEAEGFMPWLRELLRHLMNRFGIRHFDVEALLDAAFDRDEAVEYRTFVRSLRSLFEALQVGCTLCGPGLILSSDGANLSSCLKAKPELDRITIRCAPIGIVRESNLQVRKIPESDYLLRQYQLGREILWQNDIASELLISGWRTSLGSGNILNDSSWTAAKIVQTALGGYGILPALPLECPLELLGEITHPDAICAGREGVLTLNRLPKPSFYALRFLKHLDEYYLYHDPHVIVSASADGYMQIVLQNNATLSHQYYLHDEEIQTQPGPVPNTFFESLTPYQVRLRFTGLSNGQWMMKTRIVNDSTGSVYQAWMSLNYQNTSFFGQDEAELLRARALPDIRGDVLTSHGGVLEVLVIMEPNEIRHIHLLPIR